MEQSTRNITRTISAHANLNATDSLLMSAYNHFHDISRLFDV